MIVVRRCPGTRSLGCEVDAIQYEVNRDIAERAAEIFVEIERFGRGAWA